jgi:Raf kinase inhibitor-like YbhB/YbcL family protein
MRDPTLWLTFGAALLALGAFASGGSTKPALDLSSPSFQNGGPIPRVHSCDGSDRSPALVWSGVPEGTKSLVLTCDDPDAPMGTWVHWVLFDLPPDLAGLPEGVPPSAALAGGGVQGLNSWGKSGYGGPCPPPGKPHRYFFRLYALDVVLGLSSGATQAQVLAAMKGHVLAEGEWMGTYRR